MNNYVIFDPISGAVSMMIETDNPDLLALNTPAGHDVMSTLIKNVSEIDKVNIKTGQLKLIAGENLANQISQS